MLHLALRGVRHNVSRYVATLLAILTGVAFFTATGFVSDRVIQSLEGDVDKQYGNVEVAVVADTSTKAPGGSFAEKLRIPGATAAQIRAVPGVTGVAGTVTGPVAFLAKSGRTFGAGSTGRLWVTDKELNPVQLTKGRAPRGPDEIAIDRGLASRESLRLGGPATVLSVSGRHDATIVGITSFGSAEAIDQGGTVSIPPAAAFAWLTDGRVEYQDLFLRGSADAATLQRRITPLVPRGFVAQTGDEFRADQRDQAGSFGRLLKTGLQAFALLALFVGAFVIYNTFSVIVAQRQRELAVLSAIGATPKQIKRSLRYEGIAVGIIGSSLGVVVGIGLTFLLIAVLELVGVSLPGSGIVISPGNVVSGILLGTLVTLFSVMIPARRAARIEPIEALRDAAVESRSVPRSRVVTAGVMVGLGLVALFLGGSAVLIGLGALLVVVGTIVAGPMLATFGARLFRPVLSRAGLEGRLALDNSARNPKRTATTANALLIGVFLVTFVTVAGTSLKDFVVSEIQKLKSADYVVASAGGSLDETIVRRLGEVKGVEQVTPFRRESVTINGEPSQLSTDDGGKLLKVANIKVEKGSLADLGAGTVAMLSSSKQKLGETVKVANADGRSADLKVVALLNDTIDASQVGNLVAAGTFDDLVGATAPTVAFIDAKEGTESDTKKAIDKVVAERPDISVFVGNSIAQIVGSIFDFMINAVNGLLMMSVIVALIGIVNTLSLSILERRRELGLLRVVGMTDRRVQRMVRLESGLIAGLGTLTGIVLGLLVGWGLLVAINRLSDASIALGFPFAQLLLVLVLGIVLGVLASFIPARRSTRLEVLDAIQSS
jgi:putative ABC transport system permease protein